MPMLALSPKSPRLAYTVRTTMSASFKAARRSAGDRPRLVMSTVAAPRTVLTPCAVVSRTTASHVSIPEHRQRPTVELMHHQMYASWRHATMPDTAFSTPASRTPTVLTTVNDGNFQSANLVVKATSIVAITKIRINIPEWSIPRNHRQSPSLAIASYLMTHRTKNICSPRTLRTLTNMPIVHLATLGKGRIVRTTPCRGVRNAILNKLVSEPRNTKVKVNRV